MKVLILLAALQIIINAQVTVHLQQPPPFQFKLEHLWKVTLINPTTETYTVYLHASATELSQGAIVEGTTAPFLLPPGVKVVNQRELIPMDIEVKNTNYTDVIRNYNAVPAGDYEICVIAIDAQSRSELGMQCIQTEAQNISTVELLGPEDNSFIESGKALSAAQSLDENIQIADGSFIVFNWLPPAPVYPGQNVTYSITITEILGFQSAYDAAQSNPAFYKQHNIYSTIFQLPSAARGFSPGKRYAWQVSAFINGVLISSSEVREFTFGKHEAALTEKKFKRGNRGLFQKGSLPTGLSGYTPNSFQNNFMQLNSDESAGSNFVLSGSVKIEAQTTHREGFNSEIPERYTNLELYPSLSIFGIPFTTNILLSTQQQPEKQGINSFGLNFDIQAMRGNLQQRLTDKAGEQINSELTAKKNDLESKIALKDKINRLEGSGNRSEIDSLKNQLTLLESATGSIDDMKSEIEGLEDPENLKDNLDRFDLISGSEKILMNIQTFGIGTTYPSYTPHTLSGIPVSGINIEVTPAFLYLAFTGTLNQRGIVNTTYQRDLFAGRIGAGTKDESHIHITGLYAKDDEFSIITDPSNSSLTPKANYLFGLEGKLRFFDNNLIIEGEAVGSMLTRDTRAADLEIDGIPGIVKNLMQPKISSSFDFMYAAKTSYNLEETSTKFSFGLKMIGPGYTTLGVPNMRSDYLGYEGKIDQKLLNKKISLVTSFKTNRDNLIDWKSYTTTTTSFNVNLGLRFQNLPVLNLVYSPFFQKNSTDDLSRKIDNKTSMYSIMTSYSYPVMEFQSSTNFVFSLQESKTLAGISDFSTDNYMLTQTASFDLPVTFAGSFGIIHLKPAGFFMRITTFDLNASFPVFEIFQSTLGFRTAVEKDNNKKYGFYLGTSVTLLESFILDLRAEQSSYTEWNFLTQYSDAIVRISIQAAL